MGWGVWGAFEVYQRADVLVYLIGSWNQDLQWHRLTIPITFINGLEHLWMALRVEISRFQRLVLIHMYVFWWIFICPIHLLEQMYERKTTNYILTECSASPYSTNVSMASNFMSLSRSARILYVSISRLWQHWWLWCHLSECDWLAIILDQIWTSSFWQWLKNIAESVRSVLTRWDAITFYCFTRRRTINKLFFRIWVTYIYRYLQSLQSSCTMYHRINSKPF